MALLGIESVVYGVDDLDLCTRFFDDFGLTVARRDGAGTDFALAEGSSVRLRRHDDPALPAPYGERRDGVRELGWGADSAATVDAIERELARDRAVTRDASGTLHSHDDAGIPIAFRVYDRRPPVAEPVPENAPGHPARIDAHRKWYRRARPTQIHHAVFGAPDPAKAARFYIDRLGFLLSDVSKGLGIFLRCDGRPDHHNIFFLDSARMKATGTAFNHVSYGVENIDEMMVGADAMQRRGWSSHSGAGRHRISSTLYYYVACPAGGEVEYSADCDHLTKAWKPRLWHPNFGSFSWIDRLPDRILSQPEPDWDVRVIEDANPDLAALLREGAAVGPAFSNAARDAAE
ncbi:MAG: VOC family protein [Alphaproteobacteria bacterium]